MKFVFEKNNLKEIQLIWNYSNTSYFYIHIFLPFYHLFCCAHKFDFAYVFFVFLFIFSQHTGTDSEVSFSLLSGHHGLRGQQQSNTVPASNRNGLNQGLNSRLVISPGSKPVKIAAISGKPRVQRYLSRECECFFF